MYTTSWCGYCARLKTALKSEGIKYTEVDIEKTPGAAEELIRQTGKRAIPQFVIDGKWVQPYKPGYGFLYDEMAELLGVGSQDSDAPATQPAARQGSSS